MKRHILGFVALAALTLASSGASAQPMTCGEPTNFQQTADAHYAAMWGCRWEFLEFYVRAFEMDESSWNEGFGWEEPCDLSKPLARTFNALHALYYSAENPRRS